MKQTHKWITILMLIMSFPFTAGCSARREVDFVRKYQVDLEVNVDVSGLLQQAIDELPKGGVLYLQDGIYPLESVITFKEDMTLKLGENAILLNRQSKPSPTMAFNHPFKHKEAKGYNNIVIEGGIWDLNGHLNEDGTPRNLPNLESVNALGIGYASNILVRNVTFRDCYNGHVIQIAACDNVTIENCRFEGQWLKGIGDKTRELVQIEPGSIKGYPYTLVQNKLPSTNVTIRDCYFGGSKGTPQYMVAIGTHSQQAGVKCSNILIEGCNFDSSAFATIRFMAYDHITIRNNTFNLDSPSNQKERYGILADTYGGAFLDPSGADSTNELLIEDNVFNIGIPSANAMKITTNNGSPKRIKGVYIKNNTIVSPKGSVAIDLNAVEKCLIEGNKIEGYETLVFAKDCEDQIQSDIIITSSFE